MLTKALKTSKQTKIEPKNEGMQKREGKTFKFKLNQLHFNFGWTWIDKLRANDWWRNQGHSQSKQSAEIRTQASKF